MLQRRWSCSTCNREWLFAYRWHESQGCPICHNQSISLIEYKPLFPGADIRTKEADLPRNTQPTPVSKPVSTVTDIPTPLTLVVSNE